MEIVLYIFTFFCAHEALQWGWSLGQHALWMSKHNCYPECKEINCRMAGIASIMASILSGFVGVWTIYIIISSSPTLMVCLLLGTCVHLSHIHFMALIARCTAMPVECWPLMSKWISIHLISKYIYRNPPR
jgi:hypothetical protein